MNKTDLLKLIAQKGYDIGFGAKKHFATYDIIEKTPGWINFLSISIGILGLVFDCLSTKLISAIIVIFAISSLYINFYEHKKKSYDDAGKDLTKLLNETKALYYKVRSLPESTDLAPYENQLQVINDNLNSIGISKQILLSNWYAHYKFYWEHQIDWIDEQLNFKLFRDKIPLSLILFIFIVCICTWLYLFNFTECL